MPKKPRRFGLAKGPINASFALATLASNDVLSGNLAGTVDRNCRVTSIEATYSLHNLTAGEGPVVVGVSHGDYTDAEIEEALEAGSGGWTKADKVSAEQANRLVREIGTFSGEATEETLNEGRPIKTKLNWGLATGQQLKIWAWNKSGGPLTTGSSVKATGHGWITK